MYHASWFMGVCEPCEFSNFERRQTNMDPFRDRCKGHLGRKRLSRTEKKKNRNFRASKLDETFFGSQPSSRPEFFRLFSDSKLWQIRMYSAIHVAVVLIVAGERQHACSMRCAKAHPVVFAFSLDYYWSWSSSHWSTSAHAEALHMAVGTRESTTCTRHARKVVCSSSLFMLSSINIHLSGLSKTPTALVLDETSCRWAWWMPHSLLPRGQRQGSRGRYHQYYPIPSARGDAWGVRERVWDTAAVLGRCGLCCWATCCFLLILDAPHVVRKPKSRRQFRTPMLSENGVPLPAGGRPENDIWKV